MPNYQSKLKHQSVFGCRKLIDTPNFIAEQIVLRRTKKIKVKLPDRFWLEAYRSDPSIKQWQNTYKAEMIQAKELIKIYGELVTLKAVLHPEASNILSICSKPSKEKIIRLIYKLKRTHIPTKPPSKPVEKKSITETQSPFRSINTTSKIGKLR
jgi:hypothetical protein